MIIRQIYCTCCNSTREPGRSNPVKLARNRTREDQSLPATRRIKSWTQTRTMLCMSYIYKPRNRWMKVSRAPDELVHGVDQRSHFKCSQIQIAGTARLSKKKHLLLKLRTLHNSGGRDRSISAPSWRRVTQERSELCPLKVRAQQHTHECAHRSLCCHQLE